MRKVLVITYYWPPTGGSGVQRWLKFVKYLPEFGWKPIIYTPDNPDISATDTALLKDIAPDLQVIKTKISEPYGFYKKFMGQKRENKIKAHIVTDNSTSLKQKISVFIRGNFFIPDPRCWWIKPSVKYLTKYLKEHPVDMIVSTGPPHSMHLIAKKVSKATGIKWVADFRDPWTEIFYFNQLKLTKFARNKHLKQEQSVLENADGIVVVTKQMQESYQKRTPSPIALITNGFDTDDFKLSAPYKKRSYVDYQKFDIVYTGLFSQRSNVEILWQILGEKAETDPLFRDDLKITVMGQIDTPILEDIRKAGVIDNFKDLGYVPHTVAIEWQKNADMLLLALPKGKESAAIITGKFFEYIASGKPILAFGPVKGNLGEIIRETESGEIFEFDDYEGTKKFIDKSYEDFLDKRKNSSVEKKNETELSEKVLKYSRRNLTKEISKFFDKLSL